jgi:FtsH-binding integral membrane protein
MWTAIKAIFIGLLSLVATMLVIGISIGFTVFGWILTPVIMAVFAGLAYYDMKKDGTL